MPDTRPVRIDNPIESLSCVTKRDVSFELIENRTVVSAAGTITAMLTSIQAAKNGAVSAGDTRVLTMAGTISEGAEATTFTTWCHAALDHSGFNRSKRGAKSKSRGSPARNAMPRVASS